ncbi:hypothetical protein BST96_03570 [Oceanicoccus sagamiensis]|uniref:Response regulatory domain-containing protein n=1 Tax=Oceanicoccus sagamiensis TaxID=716816 RepID=A0A1X9NLL4_9GAMM|nr:hypothetical protein BST96_03570 [Oceanicoccus sagamiensis]
MLTRLHVLVVDDMEVMRSMVNSCLKEIGVTHITMCSNGDSAWRTLAGTSIDVIICDWDMPGKSGLELLNLVRSSDQHKTIPFLMLTATTEKERVADAVKAGVNDYLAKPFQSKELEYRVVKLLRKVKQ